MHTVCVNCVKIVCARVHDDVYNLAHLGGACVFVRELLRPPEGGVRGVAVVVGALPHAPPGGVLQTLTDSLLL